MPLFDSSNNSQAIHRREAIRRTALMFGAVISSSAIDLCMAADRSALTTGSNWAPHFITKGQAAVLNAATELIIPRTDTPGAQDLAIPPLIDLLYGKYLNDSEKTVLTDGLSVLEQQDFHQKSTDDQAKLMIAMAKSKNASDKTFLRKLRELTLLGYFTSEEVGKNITRYDPIPGPFRGCVPISEIGNVIPTL